MIKETDLSYLAGIIDGEGSVCFSKNGRLTLSLSSTDLELLIYLNKIFPGKLYPVKKAGKYRQQYQLSWRNKDGLQLAEKILPYLRIYRKQYRIKVLLDNQDILFQNRRYSELEKSRRLDLYERIKEI